MTDFEEPEKTIQRINARERTIKRELKKIEKLKREIVSILAQSMVKNYEIKSNITRNKRNSN